MDEQAPLPLRESVTAMSVRKAEDTALLSSSPAESRFFNLPTRSLTLSGNPSSWSNDEQVKVRMKGTNGREKNRTRVTRSATPTNCYHQQSVNSFTDDSCQCGGGVAHSDESDETEDGFVMVYLSSSGSVRQLPSPRRTSSSHLHQCRSTDQADELYRPVRMDVLMLSRSSSCDDMLLISEEAVDHPFKKTSDKLDLHSVKSTKHLAELLALPSAVPDGTNEAMDAPIHTYIRKQYKDRAGLLLTLFSNSAANIDIRNGDYLTPLHLAAQMNDSACVKVLVALGADQLAMNGHNQIPMDLAKDQLKELLMRLLSRPRLARAQSKEMYTCQQSDRLNDYLHPDHVVRFALKLEEEINKRMEMSADITLDAAAFMQLREIDTWRRTMTREQLSSALHSVGDNEQGSRILFLDGGGTRALVEIEILMDIEKRTGHKITELFDWIVGTSTGAILALGLVYARKSLLELKQLYLRLKSEVFGGGILKIVHNSEALDRLLKMTFGAERLLSQSDVSDPNVMICVVDKSTSELKVKFFNNFYDNSPELTEIPVWQAARAAGAGPTYFTSHLNYVDGGVKANNPCEYAMAEIHNYYTRTKQSFPRFKIAVSVGTGNFPAKKIGKIDPDFKNISDAIATPKHLFDLLMYTLSNSEEVAHKFRTQCERENIPFFRFNPSFPKEIPPDETNGLLLVDMILQTKLYLVSVECLASVYEMVAILMQ